MMLGDKSFIWSPLELAILLSLSDIQELYGYVLPNEQQATRKDFIKAIYSLVDSGAILPDYGGNKPYRLSQQVEICLTAIRKTNRILSFYSSEFEASCLAYCGEDGWCIVEETAAEDAYRVRYLPTEEIIDWLSFEDIWNYGRLDTDAEIESLSAVEDFIGINRASLLTETSSVELPYLEPASGIISAIVQRDDKVIAQASLIKRGEFLFLLELSDKAKRCVVFTEEERQRFFERLARGKKIGTAESLEERERS